MNKKELRQHTERMLFLGIIVGIIIGMFLFVMFQSITKKQDKIEREEIFNELGIRQEYREQTQRLFNETGTPSEFTCEQIKIMIQASVYPPHILEYECKSNPNEEYSLCGLLTNPNTKENFVNYYLLNCLEGKANFE